MDSALRYISNTTNTVVSTPHSVASTNIDSITVTFGAYSAVSTVMARIRRPESKPTEPLAL